MFNFNIPPQFEIVLKALRKSGSLFRGLGMHLMVLKNEMKGVISESKIIPSSILVFDGVLSLLSFFISIFIVIGNDFFDYTHHYILKNMLVFGLTSISVLSWMQIHKTFWRYFSLEDCIPLALAVFLTTLLYLPMLVLLSQQEALPKAVPFVNFFVYLGLLCLSRYGYRMMYDHRSQQKKILLSEQITPVLLVGSGHSTDLFIREIMHSPALSFEPIGILSPNPREKGRKIHTVPILGAATPPQDILKMTRSLVKRPLKIIITEANLPIDFLENIQIFSKMSGLPMMQMLAQFSVVQPPAPSPSSYQNGGKG